MFALYYNRARAGRGLLTEILGGGVPPGSPNPDPISDQKLSFSRPVFGPGDGHKTQHYMFVFDKTEIMSLCSQQKDFLKSISNSHITLSFLFIWN